jgi:hypothetical protein
VGERLQRFGEKPGVAEQARDGSGKRYAEIIIDSEAGDLQHQRFDDGSCDRHDDADRNRQAGNQQHDKDRAREKRKTSFKAFLAEAMRSKPLAYKGRDRVGHRNHRKGGNGNGFRKKGDERERRESDPGRAIQMQPLPAQLVMAKHGAEGRMVPGRKEGHEVLGNIHQKKSRRHRSEDQQRLLPADVPVDQRNQERGEMNGLARELVAESEKVSIRFDLCVCGWSVHRAKSVQKSYASCIRTKINAEYTLKSRTRKGKRASF